MCEKGRTEKVSSSSPDLSYRAVPCTMYVGRQALPAGPDPLDLAKPNLKYGDQRAKLSGPDWCSVIRTPTPGLWPKQATIRQNEIKQEQERSVRIKRILQENKPALK
uniref:Uncharacterized protein n=1 Tax=viral metagenome TaxID=1070528 RepID=A0A6C0DGU3_9ZZZZ